MMTNAAEWRNYEMWEIFENPKKTTPAGTEAIIALQREFIEDYQKKHGVTGLADIECISFTVPSERLDFITSAIRREVRQTDMDAAVEPPDGSMNPIMRYVTKKQRAFVLHDEVGKTLLEFSVFSSQSAFDKNSTNVTLFMHPQMRAIIAAHLLQQETAARFGR